MYVSEPIIGMRTVSVYEESDDTIRVEIDTPTSTVVFTGTRGDISTLATTLCEALGLRTYTADPQPIPTTTPTPCTESGRHRWAPMTNGDIWMGRVLSRCSLCRGQAYV